MSYIRVEKDGLQYGAEYFREEDMVTVFGVRGGHSSVVLNGMTEVALLVLRYEILLEKIRLIL